VRTAQHEYPGEELLYVATGSWDREEAARGSKRPEQKTGLLSNGGEKQIMIINRLKLGFPKVPSVEVEGQRSNT